MAETTLDGDMSCADRLFRRKATVQLAQRQIFPECGDTYNNPGQTSKPADMQSFAVTNSFAET